MNSQPFGLHDVLSIGANGVYVIVAVAVLRSDIKWLRDAFTKHERLDDQRFEAVDRDIRDLRKDIR
jgi:hypothetical protein